jgi:hypothetical protein
MGKVVAHLAGREATQPKKRRNQHRDQQEKHKHAKHGAAEFGDGLVLGRLDARAPLREG